MASFLDLFPATDPAGVSASRYRLNFLGSPYLHQDSWVFGLLAELVYTGYQMAVIPANALLGLVFSSGAWLQPMSELYTRVVGPLYAVFPPWSIACIGLAIVVSNMLHTRVASGKSGIFTSEAWDRLGVAIGMAALVAVLASNPFAVVMRVLEIDTAIASDFAAKVTSSGNSGIIETGQALVDQSVRTPTISLNYGHEFSGQCKQQWSEAQLAAQELGVDSGCYIEGQNKAGPDTVFTTLLMLILTALPMLVFSVIAAWKYILHLSMSVLSAVSLAWVGALKVHHRRGFENVSEVLAKVAAHMFMFVVINAVAVALPATCSAIALRVVQPFTDQEAAAYLTMVTLGIGFGVSVWVIYRVSANNSALVRILKADAHTTLEATLGMSPKPIKWRDMKLWGFNPFGQGAASAASPAGGDSRKSGVVVGAPRNDKGGAMPDSSLTEDSDAVKALVATAVSVADASASGSAPSAAAAMSLVDSAMAGGYFHYEQHHSRAWQSERNLTSVRLTRFGDVYGYYTDNSARNSTVNDYSASTIDGEVIGVVYDDDGNVRQRKGLLAPLSALPASSPSLPPSPDDGLASGSVSPPPDDGSGGGSASALAEVGAISERLMLPVEGNVYADPALNDAALAVGATFEIVGNPQHVFAVASPLPGFDGEQIAVTSSSFAVMPAPEAVAVGLSATAAVDAGETPRLDEVPPVNDQQRWNRGGWRASVNRVSTVADSAAGESRGATAGAEPPSGIHAGVNLHPGGFMAPMPDFIAADLLEAQLYEVRLVHAAAGESVVVIPPDGDSRLSVRLSTDPDERVVRLGEAEFGDPL